MHTFKKLAVYSVFSKASKVEDQKLNTGTCILSEIPS